MNTRRWRGVGAIFVALVSMGSPALATDPPPPGGLQAPPVVGPSRLVLFDQVTQLRDGGQLEIRGEHIASTIVVPEF